MALNTTDLVNGALGHDGALSLSQEKPVRVNRRNLVLRLLANPLGYLRGREPTRRRNGNVTQFWELRSRRTANASMTCLQSSPVTF